jgi:hypothetical protein
VCGGIVGHVEKRKVAVIGESVLDDMVRHRAVAPGLRPSVSITEPSSGRHCGSRTDGWSASISVDADASFNR